MNNNEFEMTVPKFPYTCANIGLKLSSDQLEAFKYNFLRELKALNIIDNYVFYIEYNETNNKEGNLIIGKKPHEENNKYDYKQYKEIYALNMEIELYWILRFDTIFLKNIEKGKNLFLIYQKIVRLLLNIILIIFLELMNLWNLLKIIFLKKK